MDRTALRPAVMACITTTISWRGVIPPMAATPGNTMVTAHRGLHAKVLGHTAMLIGMTQTPMRLVADKPANGLMVGMVAATTVTSTLLLAIVRARPGTEMVRPAVLRVFAATPAWPAPVRRRTGAAAADVDFG
jgi:hypothetical protein